PIDASDLNTLATLAPGVVGIGETDSTSTAFSVAGQRSTANTITLDGLSFGSGNVPQDALRTTRVVTSTYDVARGQFSGGLVASTTRSGTNVPQGSFTYALRDRDLAWGGVTESPFDQGYTQNQLGGGMGGPILPNRLFVFGSLQGRWRGQALPSLVSADAPSLERLGVSPDSAARFLALAGATGVPMTVPALPGDRATDNSVALLRIDWNLADAQTLMVRLDGRWSSQDPTRVSPLALPATGGPRAPTQAWPLPEGSAPARSTSAEPIRDVRVSIARCPRRGTAGAVHPHARPARASGDGLERRPLPGRHLASGRRIAAHLRRAARGGPLHRGAAVQPRRRLVVRRPDRPDPAGAARVPPDRLHLDRGGRGREIGRASGRA